MHHLLSDLGRLVVIFTVVEVIISAGVLLDHFQPAPAVCSDIYSVDGTETYLLAIVYHGCPTPARIHQTALSYELNANVSAPRHY
jgi:hypothetical protein